MWRACIGYCRRMSRAISCWQPGRLARCVNSSSWLSQKSAEASSGAARAWRKPALTRSRAKRSFASIRRIFVRPKSISWSAMPARRARNLAGSRRRASRSSSRKWWRAILPSPGGRLLMAKIPFDLKGKSVFVAGDRGMVGAALVRRLAGEGVELLTVAHRELDLRDQAAVSGWFAAKRPQVVFLAAAKVGGIVANNTLRAEFIYDNLLIAANVIHAAHVSGAEKLMFLGSSCIYPKLAPQPLREDSMLTGPLEPTNEPYAIAKIAGIKMVEAYRSQYGCDFINVMPTNLYGPGDNYHPEYSHVTPALIRRIHEAKVSGASEVVVWGTGTPRREFLYVDDMADGLVPLVKNYLDPGMGKIRTRGEITNSGVSRPLPQTP